MIRGAIFDLDGTLLDSNGFWERAPEAWLAALGKRAKPGLGRAIFSMTLPEAADYLIAEYGLAQTPEEIAAGVNAAMERFYRQEIPVKPGAPALIRALHARGVPCAVASVTCGSHHAFCSAASLPYFSLSQWRKYLSISGQ